MSREFSLGIVSMAGRHEIEFVLGKSGLAKHFTTIVSAADVEKCKPDPACFRLEFQQLDSARTALGYLADDAWRMPGYRRLASGHRWCAKCDLACSWCCVTNTGPLQTNCGRQVLVRWRRTFATGCRNRSGEHFCQNRLR